MLNILFLTASIKKYDGRISSPVVGCLETFGSVSVIETDTRSHVASAKDSRRAPKESGVILKRIVAVSPGLYINPTQKEDGKADTLKHCFARVMRGVDCVVANLTIGCPQMGYLITVAVNEETPVFGIHQQFTHVSRKRFELFKQLEGIDICEFSDMEELSSIFRQFTRRMKISHAV